MGLDKQLSEAALETEKSNTNVESQQESSTEIDQAQEDTGNSATNISEKLSEEKIEATETKESDASVNESEKSASPKASADSLEDETPEELPKGSDSIENAKGAAIQEQTKNIGQSLGQGVAL